jgi:hypothetical protein
VDRSHDEPITYQTLAFLPLESALHCVLTLIREGKDKVEMREEGLQLTSHAITAQSQALNQIFRSQRVARLNKRRGCQLNSCNEHASNRINPIITYQSN